MIDPDLMKIKSSVGKQKFVDFAIGRDGFLRYPGRLCVPNVDGLRERIIAKAHESQYAIHPGST